MSAKMDEAINSRRKKPDVQEDFSRLFGIESNTAKIIPVAIALLFDFPDQPFKPYSDERLKELAESIQEYGLLKQES